MKLGILGGTFDPIHLGHLRSAEEIGQHLALEKVYLIPSALPPHKTGTPVTPFHHRLAMTRLGTGCSHLLQTMDLEGNRPGFSYSIETLQELHQVFGPKADLFFIVGMDAFLEIKTWRNYKHLFDYAHFVVLSRAGCRNHGLEAIFSDLDIKGSKMEAENLFLAPSGKSITLITSTLMEISSTNIRNMVKEDKSIHFLVPETVRAYIIEKGLYQSDDIHRKGNIVPHNHS
ncbi:MAG: nicotinate (nicotinamide) nucleotide adenylyltransferase [Deltaproteobacteria bacterium]|nr:nicotinate (nicotinamide) nucleotide adenylyltransferase [Deltaproteobacteria bacterium]